MAEPNTIYKITILDMLDKVDFPLTNTQISNFFLEQDYTDYFTIQQIISGLLESELIRAESTHSNTQYSITPSGKETLSFFEEKISPAIQEDLKRFFEKNKISIKNENAIIADFYKSTNHGFAARCQIKEKGVAIIDLTIQVKTKEQAQAICQNWREQNMEVYSHLMDMLLK